ncbi:hypothetical protein ABFS82_09G045900 [Erythranthe guttata]|uniref:uncharacterized protein LOC105951616 n=1 Tax=Erythranthe guttata TaxID=4155 RepID=UPI00064DD403|nr:PREDICTED: uncharacterized protein LOC105951616 [Erythranthe guttata]|eukprot:XP_012830519.1 PREDICTED: uncharacterized protein LOC105951616 [Erythranthe guttata]
MPGNELGDRVHNFFSQDSSLQGQHHSQTVEGNWPELNGSFGVGSQRQLDLLNSNNKNHNSQNSDIDGGEGSYPLHMTHGLNFTQSNLRPDFARTPTLNEQPNLNGFLYGNQFHQTRQNEANFLAMDTNSDQRQLMTSRGLSVPDHQANASYPVSFDLFGGQQKMSYQQSSIPQSLQHQQSGVNDMQKLQQQLMIRKMQELQRHQQHQQHQQLDLRQHDSVNQVSSFAKQTSGNQSNSETLQYPWTAEHGMNWLNQGTAAVQRSPNRLGFPPNLAQTQRFVDLGPEQVDQSLYGVPVSSSRGLPVNQYSQMTTARSSIPQMSMSSNYLQGNQHNLLTDQTGVQEEPSTHRHKFMNEKVFGLASRQSPNSGMRNMGGLQQVNSMPRNTPQQDLAVHPATSHEKPTRQVASPQSEVALDPTEEKILFGSDDNIWAAFGEVPDMSGEAGNSFNNGGVSNGLPSIQSGSWSALMQSAVAETSSSDIAPQEEWSGLSFRNNDGPLESQLPSMRSNQLVEKSQNEPGQRLLNELPQSSFPSVEEAGKWSNSSPLQNLVAEGGPTYRDASPHPLQAERNAKTNSPTWIPGHTGSRPQSNGWNALAALPPGGDRVTNTHGAEKLQQNSHNSQPRVMQEVAHGSSLWNSNSVPSSSTEFGRVNSRFVNPQANQISLQDASVANSSNTRISNETSPRVQSNYLFNQWKNAHPAVRSKGGENVGRLMHQANGTDQVLDSMDNGDNEVDNGDGKENSNDSHRSNLSQHTSGGFREGGLSDASDSQSFMTGKQMPTNQLSRKISAPRKFQYHPMGNEDVEPTYGLKQPTRVQAMSQQNVHLGQLKMFGQVSRNSTATEKGQSSELQENTKGPDEESSRGNLSGRVPNIPVPLSRPIDTYISNNASSSSQNMLELLHKVDQSGNHDTMMQFSSSEQNASSQLPESESAVAGQSQGFGLQLGPPSQRLQSRDQLFSSQNGQGTLSSLYPSSAAAEIGDKGRQMAHSLETQFNFKHIRSAIPGHAGTENSLYKAPANFNSSFLSGIQNQKMTSVTEQMSTNQHVDAFNGNASCSAQKSSAETSLPDASGSFQQGNLASSRNVFQQRGPTDVHERVLAATMPTKDREQSSQKFAMPNISRHEGLAQNTWTNVPTHQHNMGVQFQRASSHVESPQPNIVESSSAPLMQGHVNSQGHADGEEQKLKESSGQPVPSVKIDPVSNMKKSLGKASSTNNRVNESPPNPVSTQKDIEAFGRSLRPNSFSPQNYSLLNQIEALKDGEIDPSNRVAKRIKGSGNITDVRQSALDPGRQNEHNALVGDTLGSSTETPSQDSKLLGFSRPADILPSKIYQQENQAAKDVTGLSRDVSQTYPCNDYMTSVVPNHPKISPQMAPSWFNQYGTFKNGQMLQVYDAHKVTPLRPVETPFTLGKSSSGLDVLNSEEKGTAAPVDACQIINSDQNSTPSSVVNQCFSSIQSSQPNAVGQNLVSSRSKKRKTATSELHPWHKEISEGSLNLWTLSMAEADWNKAANSLSEKVEDDGVELYEDGPPSLRSKRRLILTTHLMQQLLRPAPAAILSADARSSYEIVAYSVSRIALGDACSKVSCSSHLDSPSDGMNLLLSKGRSSKRNGGHYAEVTEKLMGQAKKLENDLSRLDNSTSILDLRLECQDLEKFSVINRFARFHGRESDVTDSTHNRPIPQRYVTALPMPRSITDTVQCLSL